MRTLLAIGGGLLATAWTATLFAAEPAPEPELLFTRKRDFKIPFQIDPPKTPGERPKEVHLYMSDSRGVEAWPLVGVVPPDRDSFEFQSRQDGEYWFVVRTVDSQGRLLPESQGETKPELKVLVDATAPVLELQALASPRGEVIMLRWHCEDLYLTEDRPTIEYRPASDLDGPWRKLAINPGVDGEANIPAPEEAIAVRAVAIDMAGNQSARELVIDKECKTPVRGVPTEAATPKPETAMAPNPPATPGLSPPSVPSVSAPVAPAGGYDPTATAPTTANYAQAYGAPPTSMAADPFGYSPAAPTAVPPTAIPSPGTGPTAYGTDYTPPASNAGAAKTPNSGVELFDGLAPGSSVPNIADPTARMPGSVATTVPNTFSTTPTAPVSPASPAPVSPTMLTSPTSVDAPAMGVNLPRDAMPEMVNSRSFEVDYDVESVGPSGISKVEIYGTTDGGRSWKLFGADDDRRSPIRVEVPTEGAYGFKLLVQTGSGVGGEPPRPGDAPDKWVLVDVTKPQAAFMAITNAEGSTSDLVIRWQASDNHLEPKPVSLSYSYEAQGPWYPVVKDTENTGVFYWRSTTARPKQVHLKLDVKDAAGNITTVLSSEATGADRMQPKVQVRAARAVPDPNTTLR